MSGTLSGMGPLGMSRYDSLRCALLDCSAAMLLIYDGPPLVDVPVRLAGSAAVIAGLADGGPRFWLWFALLCVAWTVLWAHSGLTLDGRFQAARLLMGGLTPDGGLAPHTVACNRNGLGFASLSGARAVAQGACCQGTRRLSLDMIRHDHKGWQGLPFATIAITLTRLILI